jgi:hypothetical protein
LVRAKERVGTLNVELEFETARLNNNNNNRNKMKLFACERAKEQIKGKKKTVEFIIFSGFAAQRGLWPPRHTRFLDHTQRRATVGRIPLDE